MSSFSDQNFVKKLTELNGTQQSIQTLSLWLIHHRKHSKSIIQVWYRELQKGKAGIFIEVWPYVLLSFLFLFYIVKIKAKLLRFNRLDTIWLLFNWNSLIQSKIRLGCVYGVGLRTKFVHFLRSSTKQKRYRKCTDKLIEIDYSLEFQTSFQEVKQSKHFSHTHASVTAFLQ